MAEVNDLQEIFSPVTEDFISQMREARRVNAVPLGQQRLSPAEARVKFANTPREEKQRMLDEGRQAELLMMARGK